MAREFLCELLILSGDLERAEVAFNSPTAIINRSDRRPGAQL